MRKLILAAIAAAVLGRAQAPAPVTFEVASVRVDERKQPPSPLGSTESGGPGTNDPTHLRFTWMGMLRILMRAYGVERDQVSGPDWVTDDNVMYQIKFDIEANIPKGATKEQVQEMLQNLLKERFHLVVHREKKDFDVYELTQAKGGAKLKPAEIPDKPPPEQELGKASRPPKDRDGFPELPAGRTQEAGYGGIGVMRSTFRMSTPQELLRSLAGFLGTNRTVDHTGLTGKYDFRLEFSQEGLPGPSGRGIHVRDADPAPDLFSALEEQLGLKLTKSKAQLDVIVIDRIDKDPTDN